MSRRLSVTGADPVGICLAGACAVHCLVTPVLVGLLPVIGLGLADPRTEWLLMLVSLSTSAYVLVRGCVRQHRQLRALIPFVIGAALLLTIRVTGDSDAIGPRLVMVAGALLVVASHALNIRLCRRAGADTCGRISPQAVTDAAT